MLFLSPQRERDEPQLAKTRSPLLRAPLGLSLFLLPSQRPSFSIPAGSASPSELSSAGKGREQRKTKTSDGMTFARKRNQRVSTFNNSRMIYSLLVSPSIDAYFVLAFRILLVSSPPGYPIASIVCRLAAQLPAAAGKIRIVKHASGKFLKRDDS